MKTVEIRLSTIADVRDFVNIVSATKIDVDLSSGRYIVDGKSIMGIFSLDLAKPIKIEIFDDNCDNLVKELESFIV